jgi:hypothetical protein
MLVVLVARVQATLVHTVQLKATMVVTQVQVHLVVVAVRLPLVSDMETAVWATLVLVLEHLTL